MRPSARVLSAALPLLVVALAGCPSRCGQSASTGSATSQGAASSTPARPPANLVADLAIDDTKAFLEGSRSQFRDASAGVPIPANASEILERWSALPEQVRRHIPETTRLRIVWFRVGESVRSVAAVKIRREQNADHPLGVEIPLFDGAPEGAKWVAGRPSGSAPVVALRDDVLVVADDAASMREAMRWLTEDGMTEAAGPGLRVRAPGEAVGTMVRGMLAREIEEIAESALASARAEGARHAEPPALGDPAALVTAMRDRARRWLAYLPDVRDVTLRIDGGASGMTFDLAAAVAPNTPLAGALGAAQIGVPFGMRALPVSTALAISTRRDGTEMPWVDAIAQVAGSRLGAEDRATFARTADAIATMRGEASVVALGGHADGPFLFAALAPGGTSLDPDAVKDLASVPYVANALGALVGCDEVHVTGLPAGRSPLCRRTEPPYPELFVQRGIGANVVMVSSRPSVTPVPHTAANDVVNAPDRAASGGLFNDPDAQRGLASLGDRTLFVAALSARGVIPTLALLGSAGLQRLAASRSLPTSAVPIVFGVSREEDGSLSARLVAPPHALEEVWAITYLLMTLAGE